MGFGVNPHINKVSNNKIRIKINGFQANPLNFIKYKITNKQIITKLRKNKVKRNR